MCFSRNRSLEFAAVLGLLLAPRFAESQEIRFSIEPATSLAWYQIDPHYSHLWGTTCPADPNWQAGEGRTPGAAANYGWRKEAKASGRKDSRIPLYPRRRVFPVCRTAVRGGFITADTVQWSGVRGELTILPDSLETGLEMRTLYLRRVIFETAKHPTIRFVMDSLGSVQTGDTLTATAFGTLEMHGAHRAIASPVKVWRVPGGLRAQTSFPLPAEDLTDAYHMSKAALAMGTSLGRWDTVYMGVDIILRKSEPQ